METASIDIIDTPTEQVQDVAGCIARWVEVTHEASVYKPRGYSSLVKEINGRPMIKIEFDSRYEDFVYEETDEECTLRRNYSYGDDDTSVFPSVSMPKGWYGFHANCSVMTLDALVDIYRRTYR